MCSPKTVILLLVFLRREISCLKDVILDIEPRVVEYGRESTLRCSYDLENALLYTVKWYRGQFEFYRYTPKEHPSTKPLDLDGLYIDEFGSNEHQVVLRNVSFNLSGNFSCEVTTEPPLFSVQADTKEMLVVVLPKSSPSLSTDKSFYEAGDVLKANCSSPQSRPAATLTFILNNIVVCEKCVTYKHPFKELFWSESSLELPLFPSHFHNGRLTLKCVAQIGDLYQQDTDITFTNVKDPIPARVTQNSSSNRILHIHSHIQPAFVFFYLCYLQYA
ncbi:uncharacterized protein LOC132696769 isoform X2 [Cylas formicarius]|uniref:uncharacterized protein LOC132696769 isoform X2 n=1 Tax=Cylas formicarius TaxID=197179 RepID=UPI002958DAFD|nr:uncharacterized protein LOC132696769 isoform X2 [Cylas formicarius]